MSGWEEGYQANQDTIRSISSIYTILNNISHQDINNNHLSYPIMSSSNNNSNDEEQQAPLPSSTTTTSSGEALSDKDKSTSRSGTRSERITLHDITTTTPSGGSVRSDDSGGRTSSAGDSEGLYRWEEVDRYYDDNSEDAENNSSSWLSSSREGTSGGGGRKSSKGTTSKRGETTTQSQSGSGSKSTRSPIFAALLQRRKAKQKEKEKTKRRKKDDDDGGGIGDSSDENNDSSTDTSSTKAGGFWAWCCRLPLLLLLLLLLLSAVVVVTIILTTRRRPGDSDRIVEDPLSKSTVPTPSPTDTPLFKSCVCYDINGGSGGDGLIPWISEGGETSSSSGGTIYNIGGIDYKCIEEQNLTEDEVQSTNLTICVFPHPNSDSSDLGGFSFLPKDDIAAVIDSVDVTTTGELTVPNLNQNVEAITVTTTGSLSTSNFDTSSLDAEQMAEVMDYFETSIAQELQEELPMGSTVAVTSIDTNGIVQYQILTYGDTSAEANAAASSIYTTLSDASTLDSISNTVLTLSEVSPDPDIVDSLASTTVDLHTIGTTIEETTSKVTMTAELIVFNIDTSQLDTLAKVEEANEIFELAITQELTNQGLLPEGSSVIVTGIADDGTVQYDVVFYGGTSEEASAAITNIGVALSDASTLASISDTVQTVSSSSSVSSALSSASITENIHTGTAGLIMTPAEEEEAAGYFEDAITSSLGSVLPPGSTVTVTSIQDEVVSYEIDMNVSSSEEAESTVSAIEASLADASTLQAITSSVASASSSISVTVPGSLTVPNLNQNVEAITVTTTGSLSTSNFDTSSLDAEQMAEVMDYFETSIAQELQEELPMGSTVAVTSIDTNGIVQYQILTYGDTSAEANAAASSIYTTLSDASTLDSISNTVLTLSEVSPDPDIVDSLASTTVDLHTIGTTIEETTSKVTMTAELIVFNIDTSQLDTLAKVEEANEIFELAITQELTNQGLLPEGSSVIVTGIADDGTVQYDVVFYGGTSEEASAAITNIGVALSDASTLASISDTVQTVSSSSSVSSALSSASITENIHTGTAGLIMTPAEEEEAAGYFEDAITSSLGSVLPPGSTVTVTSIQDEVVSYEIDMNVSSSEEAESTVSAIEASLADASTLQAITSSVTTDLSGSSSPTLILVGANLAVVSNVTGTPSIDASATSNVLSGSTVVSNTPGAMAITELTLSEVTLDQLSLEIISTDGTSLITHDLLNQEDGVLTVLDPSGTSMTLTLPKPIAEFSPLDEDFDIASEIEICSSIPMEPDQLDRPEVDGQPTEGEVELLRPEARRIKSPHGRLGEALSNDEHHNERREIQDGQSHQETMKRSVSKVHLRGPELPIKLSRDLQQQGESADFCLALGLGDSSDSST